MRRSDAPQGTAFGVACCLLVWPGGLPGAVHLAAGLGPCHGRRDTCRAYGRPLARASLQDLTGCLTPYRQRDLPTITSRGRHVMLEQVHVGLASIGWYEGSAGAERIAQLRTHWYSIIVVALFVVCILNLRNQD